MTDRLTKKELEDLKSVGFVPGDETTIPINLSSALQEKAKNEPADDDREYHALDHDKDGRKGGSKPKKKPVDAKSKADKV